MSKVIQSEPKQEIASLASGAIGRAFKSRIAHKVGPQI
jgi:hypothetical protein